MPNRSLDTRDVQDSAAPVRAAPNWPAKHSVLGLLVSSSDYDAAVAAIFHAASTEREGLVAHVPVHALVEAHRDPEFRAQLNAFDLLAPDGQPVRWALNLLAGTNLEQRVYGPELMLRVCGEAAVVGMPIYLLGGAPNVVARLAERLVQRFPGLQVAGFESPPFRELNADEDRELVDRVNRSGARIVFVGLGCPKQEKFAYVHRERIRAVQVCVGAAFDFHSGFKPMAPSWMQRAGLEWFFRLRSEPRRLWRRYLGTNTVFLGLFGRALVGRAVTAVAGQFRRPNST